MLGGVSRSEASRLDEVLSKGEPSLRPRKTTTADAQSKAEAERATRQKERAQAETAAAKSETAQTQATAGAAVAQAQAETQQAQVSAQNSEMRAQQAESDKAKMCARLLKQLNVILQTRDAARGLAVNMSDVLFTTGNTR